MEDYSVHQDALNREAKARAQRKTERIGTVQAEIQGSLPVRLKDVLNRVERRVDRTVLKVLSSLVNSLEH